MREQVFLGSLELKRVFGIDFTFCGLLQAQCKLSIKYVVNKYFETLESRSKILPTLQ